MRTNKFNFICTLVSLIFWLMYLSEAVHSAFFAVLFATVAVTCGVLGEIFIKSKKQKEHPELMVKIDAKAIMHYGLTFLTLLVIFYTFGTFTNRAYGYHSFGSGKYGYEISFWGVGEIIPDFAYNMGHNFLPLLLVIFAVYYKPLAFCAAGLLSWIDILIVNTSKVFGSYTIVAASGNESVEETTVYNYSNEVTAAIFILVLAMLVLALIHMIFFRSKKVAVIIIAVCALGVGLFSGYMGYASHTAAKTYDVEALKVEIYDTTKEGSENFQAENFHNSFGSMSTKCVVSGCDRLIVTSGDSNCCAVHSNRCENCNQYIDGDAMFCMKCIKNALD